MSIHERRKETVKKHLSLNFFETNFKDVLNRDQILKTRIDNFLNNVNQKYQPYQANLIRRAVIVGTVAHQNNEIVEKQYRKASNGSDNPTPYIIHPLEMAESMMEGPVFDWITIAATLLHDVLEDVKLNGIEGKTAWLSTIENIFKDTGFQLVLTSVVDGVTERKIPSRNTNEETARLYDRLQKSPMYKMITKYVEHGGIRHVKEKKKEIYSEDRNKIIEVIYNLENLFLSATRSPEELRIFFIKIADVWHNLQSPEWVKDIKVLRGRIAAGLAELLGWNSMKDNIIMSLAKITDVTTPFNPHIQKDKTLFTDNLVRYVEEEAIENIKIAKQVIPQLVKNVPFETISDSISIRSGFPIPHSDTKNLSYLLFDNEKTTLPQPGFTITAPKKLFENFINPSKYRVSFVDPRNKYGKTNARVEFITSVTNKTTNLLGRKQIDLIIKTGNRKSFKICVKDDQPYIIDMFTLNNNAVSQNQIPEIGLLISDFTENEELLSTHIQALIGFCYEPSLIGQLGEGVVPIFVRNTKRLYFLPSTLGVQEASEILSIPELKESHPGQVLWDLNESINKSRLALRRIIEVE